MLHVADIGAVHPDRAACHVVKAVEQPCQCGFTRTTVSDHGNLGAGGNIKTHIKQDLPFGLITEIHILEAHHRGPFGECLRAGLILNFPIFFEQPEHAIHVDQRLFDLAIGHAQKIKRNIKLDQQRVDQHQVTERQVFCGYALRREHHQRGRGNGDNGALADIERAERSFGFYRRCFVTGEVGIITPRFEFLVVEIFDGLVVEQAVNGTGIRF